MLCTDMPVGQRNRLHEVHPLSVDLDEGEDVSGLHCIAQRVKPRRRIRTLLLGKTFLRVFGCDEVFPRLPGGEHEDTDALRQLLVQFMTFTGCAMFITDNISVFG